MIAIILKVVLFIVLVFIGDVVMSAIKGEYNTKGKVVNSALDEYKKEEFKRRVDDYKIAYKMLNTNYSYGERC